MAGKLCQQCGVALPADSPDGICPACLFQLGLASEVPDPATDPAATADRPGRFVAPSLGELTERFPELEIIELLGQGGMGAVYKARQKSLDRIVAVKILPTETARDPAFAERFAREARALAKLSHANIVIVYEFGERDGLYYIMMEYVDGVNLRDMIVSGELTPTEALAIVPQICEALQYAHDEGVVHRDIKPENVLVNKRGRVKIADFGLAKLLGRSPIELTLTASHQIMGTLHYMAPEQLERPLEVDHRADIFSLGVVFYELLTGDLPLGRFKLPSERVEIDARLDDVVLKSLERDPSDRYQHVSDVKTDVESIVADRKSLVAAEEVPAAKPRSQLSEPLTPKVEIALQQVRGPSTAMIVLGIVNLLPIAIALIILVLVAIGIIGNSRVFEHRLDDVAGPIGAMLISVPFGVLMLMGGLAIRRLGSYELARISARVALFPYGPVWLFSLPMCIWTSAVLKRNDVKSAFGQYLKGQQLRSTAVARTDRPNPGMIAMGAIMILLGLIFMFVFGPIPFQKGHFWVGIGLTIGGGGCLAGALGKQHRVALRRFHPGALCMGGVMLVVGVFLLLLTESYLPGRSSFSWIGMGIILGGGGCFAGAWNKERSARSREFNPGMLAMGGVMVLLGLLLMLLSLVNEPAILWIGLGITLGGGGCLAGTWKTVPEESPSPDSPPGAEPMKGKVESFGSIEQIDRAAHLVAGPARALFILGLIHVLIALGCATVITALIQKHPADSPPVVFWIFAPVSISLAVIVFAAAARMRRLQQRGLGIAASIAALLPLSPAFLFGLPAGIWALVVLGRSEVRAAFAHAARHEFEPPPEWHGARRRRSWTKWLLWPVAVVALVILGMIVMQGKREEGQPPLRYLQFTVEWDDGGTTFDQQRLLEAVRKRLYDPTNKRQLGTATLKRPVLEVAVHGDHEMALRVRSLLEARGTFALRVAASGELDAEIATQAEDALKNKTVELADQKSDLIVSGQTQARWIKIDASSKELILATPRVIVSEKNGSSWLLVLEDEFNLSERQILKAEFGGVKVGDSNSGIGIYFTDKGKQVWKRFCDTLFSDEAIQRKRVLAVILDGQVYELINAHTMLESNFGDITISGNFDQIRQQKDWARILTTGPMPARLHFDRMTFLGK